MEKHKSKDVFKNFERESFHLNAMAANSDMNFINWAGLGVDEEMQKLLKDEIVKHMPIIKEIHIFLQSKSPSTYPFVEYGVFREKFL